MEPQTPTRRRLNPSASLLAQFGSLRSPTSVTQLRRLERVEIPQIAVGSRGDHEVLSLEGSPVASPSGSSALPLSTLPSTVPSIVERESDTSAPPSLALDEATPLATSTNEMAPTSPTHEPISARRSQRVANKVSTATPTNRNKVLQRLRNRDHSGSPARSTRQLTRRQPKATGTEADSSESEERDDSADEQFEPQAKRILKSDVLVKGSPAQKRQVVHMSGGKRSDLYTKAKRDRFLFDNKRHFTALLLPGNYVSDLSSALDNLPAKAVDYEELEDQPAGVTATMKPYQVTGLSWLVYLHRNGMSGILGDEMGLGKTLQALSLFQFVKESEEAEKVDPRDLRPHLVVCPLSVLSTWIAEVKRWTPSLKVLQFHGAVSERERIKQVALDRKGTPTFDILVTTYETSISEKHWLQSALLWRYVVLDEGHKIKNAETNVSQALLPLKSEFRLVLTGTPLQNNLKEMWALLHWLYPMVFTEATADLFRIAFDLSKGEVNPQFLDAARRLLEIVMLRRTKTSPEVDLKLPPKEEVLLYIPLTPMQRHWYMKLMTRVDDTLLGEVFGDASNTEKMALSRERIEQEKIAELEALDDKIQNGDEDAWAESRAIMAKAAAQEEGLSSDNAKSKGAWRRLMNLLQQLRQCCNHPYLIPGAAPPGYMIGEHVVQASGKFIVLRQLLQRLVIEDKKKVLIFSGYTGMLDCVEDLLNWMRRDEDAFTYLRFDGSTQRARRNLNIRMFSDPASTHRVMLLSTKAGGFGLNLVAAANVIFLDEEWNPQTTLQAEARVHRIGQKHPVTIYKLCTQGTVEEQMLGRIRKKLWLSTKITGAMQTKFRNTNSNDSSSKEQEEMPQMSVSELKTLIRRGAQTLVRPEVDVNKMLFWGLDEIIVHCRDKITDSVAEDTAAVNAEEESAWLSAMERVQTVVFEGKRYARASGKESESLIPDDLPAERKREKRTQMINGYEVSTESLECLPWEAVPTLAGKDPRLASPKREKKEPFLSQEHCHACYDGGEIFLCGYCPRSFHKDCMTAKGFKKLNGFGGRCPQHECVECDKNANQAGGMLFRCRWCENAMCEECLDWNQTTLIGETLPEFEVLRYVRANSACYIICPGCNIRMAAEPDYKNFIASQVDVNIRLYQGWLVSHDEQKPHSTGIADVPAVVKQAQSDAPNNQGEIKPVYTPDDRSSVKRKYDCLE